MIQYPQLLSRRTPYWFVAVSVLLAGYVRAESIKSKSGLRLEFTPGGSYELSSADPKWSFRGSIGASLKNLTAGEGKDNLGDYRTITFDWDSPQSPMSGTVRLYQNSSLALFSETAAKSSQLPPAAFPAFTNLPSDLHVFSYGLHEFAPPNFSAVEISTPWMLFDDHANAFIISPASHFMVASMQGDGKTRVASGFNPNLRNLPAGFTQQTLVAFGNGINRTWDSWGHALLSLQGAKRPAYDVDATLKYLGYWTDNGATYYYKYDSNKGYAGTLQSLVERYRKEEIPIRYLQLDSWWYYKTSTDPDGTPGKNKKREDLPEGEWNRYGGLLEYRAHKDLFPNGLNAFQKEIGLPLVTHNRWVDPASPYCTNYTISGIAAIDPKWWDDIASYMKASGIVTYEQDWLDRIYRYSPGFAGDITVGAAFLDNMARACNEKGITLQYCMPYPCYFMQGSRYPNLTTIRTSGDRFNTNHWNDFLYTSRLASSLGIWPWADVYMSYELNNVLLSTLSAGPVGIGDAIGAENKANLMQAVRTDGVIIKPDAPIVPLDRCYIADAQKQPAPLIGSTYTEFGNVRTRYVFAYNRGRNPSDVLKFNTDELGVNSSAYVYDYFSKTGKLVKKDSEFSAPIAKNATAFYVVAPVGRSGIAFLGDKDKFVGTGKQRVAAMHDEPDKLAVDVVLAQNEGTIRLHGYSAKPLKATVIAGEDDPVEYDPATHYFTVEIKSDKEAPLDKSSGDPVRQLTVLLETVSK